MRKPRSIVHRTAAGLLAATLLSAADCAAHASDHLDSPTVTADPRADIGDIYAWMAPDRRRLNLVMTIVGHTFSDKLSYDFHIDSGQALGKTTTSAVVSCRFASMKAADCRLGRADRAAGDAGGPQGLESGKHRFRVFAGLRDDPFFNNVRGSRDASNVAAAAVRAGAAMDGAECPRLDAATTRAILSHWARTDGGPPKNFLAGWTPAVIVLSIDLDAVDRGGALLAVWGTTGSPGHQIDRAGRPLTGNNMMGPLAPGDVSAKLKDDYNQATPATAGPFVAEIQHSLGFYDAFDGVCGNSFLAIPNEDADIRYGPLALLLADDRLWVNSASGVCQELFAVERAALAGDDAVKNDCGGRAPSYNATNVYRSMMMNGTPSGASDGLDHDELPVSDSDFPFLAPPSPAAKP